MFVIPTLGGMTDCRLKMKDANKIPAFSHSPFDD